jgi:molybdopterin/thiamine biosynthesis adenylyltransferase
MNKLSIVVVGLGGVGSILIERLGRFLNYGEYEANMLLVDGDEYEVKNYQRQEFNQMGNKSEVKATELQIKFPNIILDSYDAYINETNTVEIIREGDIVFLCVDNHKTRNIISNYCMQLKDVTLISGGNELTDGNVQIYIRQGGVDLTPDLCAYHPEIANPEDKLPEELSCEERANAEPQLYFCNLGVATLMCWAFYKSIIKGQIDQQSEVYFDILQMSANAQTRIVKTKEGES